MFVYVREKPLANGDETSTSKKVQNVLSYQTNRIGPECKDYGLNPLCRGDLCPAVACITGLLVLMVSMAYSISLIW